MRDAAASLTGHNRLEQDGFVDRVVFDVVPPHVECNLTAMGEEAAEKVRLLADWIETNLPRVIEAREARALPGLGAPAP